MKGIKRRGLTLAALAAVLLAVAQSSPGAGADERHFAAISFVRFARPVAVPDFALKDLKGNQVSFSQFKGKLVLLNFWATW